MISIIDVAFVILTVIITAVGCKRGLVVSVIAMLRVIFIVPVSYFLAQYITPYVPQNIISSLPKGAVGIVMFVAVFLALIVLTGILMLVLKALQKKKGVPLRHTNAFLGGVLGFVKALVLVLVISGCMALVAELLPNGSQAYKVINSSYIVDFISQFDLNKLKAFAL